MQKLRIVILETMLCGTSLIMEMRMEEYLHILELRLEANDSLSFRLLRMSSLIFLYLVPCIQDNALGFAFDLGDSLRVYVYPLQEGGVKVE